MNQLELFVASKRALLGFILIVLGLFLSTLVIKELFLISDLSRKTTANTITVSAQGKVTAKNNIARINLGVLAESLNVSTAQEENTKKVNSIIDLLKTNGVKEEDIKLQDYSVYPRYDYTNGKQVLVGYDVSQSLLVKIRDLTKIGDILTGAGQKGANQVGSLEFTIDEPEKLEAEALQKAILAAQEKAQTLAGNLYITLGKVVSFNESAGQVPPPSIFSEKNAFGVGGANPDTTPQITPGQNEITKTVTITYEIK